MDDMIKINNINIHIFYIESETSNEVKTLHTIFNNIEGYIKDNCESKYLTQFLLMKIKER